MSGKKIVFITGATAGFGEAMARRFAAAGHTLVLTGRRGERLSKLKGELKTPVHTIELDVRDRKAVERAVTSLPDQFKAVDILINNAGLALGLEPAHKVALEDWEGMIDTNIKGLLYVTRKAFVHQFSLNLRADLIGSRVRVTSVEPGMAETEFSVVRFKGDASKAKDVYKGLQPMTPDDIAHTIEFITTTLPDHVNINTIEMMPVMQAFGPFVVKREG
ncbi:MAG: NADP-dependent 3-hydroxy acid dehydrogenase [Alphaproteobacteria bacterium]|nr:NADP-dependent 3-hydroxy acid dehydrogenase [Alphaproteobacteria bacterium]